MKKNQFSGRQKLNSKCLQIPTGNYFISNTKQYQLFNVNKFIHKDNHSIIRQVPLCDLARVVINTLIKLMFLSRKTS